MRSPLALPLTVLIITTAALAADPKPQVFNDDSKPADKRLTQSHDLDHPWLFDPSTIKDKTEWHTRATQPARAAALVAEGLWPLPRARRSTR